MMPDMPPAVKTVFAAYEAPTRHGLLRLRGLILGTAANHPEIGAVVESLRWGQPAYLTPETGAACSLRIGTLRDEGFGLFVHCQTDLIATFLAGPGAGQRHDGTRAILFREIGDIQDAPIGMLIAGALTYHLRKRRA